jgi:homogentisate 1,2-dioxygenase
VASPDVPASTHQKYESGIYHNSIIDHVKQLLMGSQTAAGSGVAMGDVSFHAS